MIIYIALLMYVTGIITGGGLMSIYLDRKGR